MPPSPDDLLAHILDGAEQVSYFDIGQTNRRRFGRWLEKQGKVSKWSGVGTNGQCKKGGIQPPSCLWVTSRVNGFTCPSSTPRPAIRRR